MRSCGSSLSSSAVSDRPMCSIEEGLSTSSRTPPATSRMPSSPFSTSPILKVLSSAGDRGFPEALGVCAAHLLGTLPSRPACWARFLAVRVMSAAGTGRPARRSPPRSPHSPEAAGPRPRRWVQPARAGPVASCWWPAGHELSARVLVEAVEEPVGYGEGVLVGLAGEREAADEHVEPWRSRSVVAVVG